jgi:hypothetical protein
MAGGPQEDVPGEEHPRSRIEPELEVVTDYIDRRSSDGLAIVCSCGAAS